MNLAPARAGSALSPSAFYDSTTGNVYVNGSLIAVWDSSPIWGSSMVWGPSIFVSDDKKNVVWGSKKNVVWGSSTTEGFNTIWESSVDRSDGTNFAAESLGLLINGEN